MPFIPTDIVFRYFPQFTRDKVWYLYFHVSFTAALFVGIFGYCHMPFEGEHAPEGMFYNRRIRQMKLSGELEENLRIKATSFYPIVAEDEEEE